MFDFKNGMLGVVIVALAIAGALFVSYLAGVDETQHEVTKYDYLADVNLLFEYDEEPQYISYDPSTNYTGYYSQDSYYLYTGKYYFPQGQMDFSPNSKVNNYKITFKPDLLAYRDVLFSNINNIETDGSWMLLYHPRDGDVAQMVMQPAKLSSIVNNLNLNSETTHLYISTGGTDWEGSRSGSTLYLDTNLIIPKSWQYDENSGWKLVSVCSPRAYPEQISVDGKDVTHKAYTSFIVDLKAGVVEAYSDTIYNNLMGTYRLDDMLVFYGDSSFSIGTHLNLSNHLTFREILNERMFLNPNEGVWMKD